MKKSPWTEARGDGSGSLAIAVRAVDAERKERLETEEFVRAVRDPGDDTRNVPRIFTALLVVFGVYLAEHVGSWLFGPSPGVSLAFGIFGFLVLLVALGVVAVRGIQRKRDPVAAFSLRVDSSGFALSSSAGARVESSLLEIDRFEADERIALVKKDGTKKILPLLLEPASAQAALADRLNDALVEVRSAGGYRGPRVANETSEGDEGDDERARCDAER